jgi:hypothetical protein
METADLGLPEIVVSPVRVRSRHFAKHLQRALLEQASGPPA